MDVNCEICQAESPLRLLKARVRSTSAGSWWRPDALDTVDLRDHGDAKWRDADLDDGSGYRQVRSREIVEGRAESDQRIDDARGVVRGRSDLDASRCSRWVSVMIRRGPHLASMSPSSGWLTTRRRLGVVTRAAFPSAGGPFLLAARSDQLNSAFTLPKVVSSAATPPAWPRYRLSRVTQAWTPVFGVAMVT